MKTRLPRSTWGAAAVVAVVAGAVPASAQLSYTDPYTFSLFAGVPTPGRSRLPAAQAAFNYPKGLAADAFGNVYVADSAYHTIRKITPDGFVSVFAGASGLPGSTDGSSSGARFFGPSDLAADAAGNVFVADSRNSTIRKITPAGGVTTFAGAAGRTGTTDGPAATARFTVPAGLALDGGGNVYVADGSRIRKITPGGVVTTIAGPGGFTDATGSPGQFNGLTSIVVEPSGALLVADSGNHTVRRISPAGEISTLAGGNFVNRWGTADGAPTVARFKTPSGLVVAADGSVFVTDSGNHTIRRIGPDGIVSTIAGAAEVPGTTDGALGSARFEYPFGIARDAAGRLFVSDHLNHTIRVLAAGGVETLSATPGLSVGRTDGLTTARFAGPGALAVDDRGNLYVAQGGGAICIRKITPDGVVSTLAGGEDGGRTLVDGPAASARFGQITGLAVDSAGTVYVADTGNKVIRKISPDGFVSTFAGSWSLTGRTDGTGEAARFSATLGGICTDRSGTVFVADRGNSTIRKITPDGVVTTWAGAGTGGFADGVGRAAQLSQPGAIAADASGTIYVYTQGTLRKITPAAVVTTIAGNTASGSTRDGVGSAAKFRGVQGIAADRAGNLFVTDSANLIRQITPAGVVSTVAGRLDIAGSAEGSGSEAEFADPTGIAVAPDGALFVVDSNNAVRRGVPTLGQGSLPARIINLSLLTDVSAEAPSFKLGTVLGGRGTAGAKALVVRAVGPSLAAFGLSGVLADPHVEVIASAAGGAATVSDNDDWGGGMLLGSAMARVGAFPLLGLTSRDAAVAPNLAAGDYVVEVSSVGRTAGTVLAELYDATPGERFTASTPRLVNVSVLKPIGAGLTIGFVIGGSGGRTVLVRAIGPGLVAFGVTGLLPDPQMAVFSGQTPIGGNDNWGGTAALKTAFSGVGAFALADGSRDAALVATLQPGSYTVQVSGVGGTTGTALVEVYEVP